MWTGHKVDKMVQFVDNEKKVRFNQLVKTLTRKKVVDLSLDSGLTKCLSTLDLTVLGIGSTLGIGVYVVAGQVAYKQAGPAVIISFAIAAIASMIAGLCYAEFAARVPKAGSAYIYSYVTVGEFIAFIIGWTIILEYVIGVASVVRGLSSYVDDIFDNSMQKAFESVAHIEIETFSQYPDFFAFSVVITFAIAIAFGAKESSMANNILTLVNLAVVLFVIIVGSIKADMANWRLSPECAKENCPHGSGGFAPYGISGIISGAATCFYAFIGFDCVATASEEAKNAKKSIPIAIVVSLTVVFLAYFGVSTILTTVLPYYLQNPKTPIPHMFDSIGWVWAKYIVTTGAICAMCASILGSMFPLPRVIYAMASDGLIFKWMGTLNQRFHTPFIGTLTAGVLTGTISAFLDLDQLMEIMSISTLLAYSIVASCVLLLRYKESESFEKKDGRHPGTMIFIAKQLINANKLKNSTVLTSKIVSTLVSSYFVLSGCTAALIANYSSAILNGETWAVVLIVIFLTILVLLIFFLYRQPLSDEKLTFSVPLMPFIPALSIFFNLYLMMTLKPITWIRFLIWIMAGLVIYFTYGIWNSKQRKRTSSTTSGNVDYSETSTIENYIITSPCSSQL